MSLVVLRKGTGPPALPLADAEPAIDLTPGAPKLFAGVGGGTVALLADHAYVLALEARVRTLEIAVRELQFVGWHSAPLSPGTIIPPLVR